jgi:D-arabinose 1-dehydrogenase-like Zn-dependent alcohol dehydrogenase
MSFPIRYRMMWRSSPSRLPRRFRFPAQITVRPDDRIVVLGDGRLGNLCAQVLARLSRRVLVVGKHQEKLALLQSMGIDDRAAHAIRSMSAPPTSLSIARVRNQDCQLR